MKRQFRVIRDGAAAFDLLVSGVGPVGATYRWVPNFGMWVRDDELGSDLYSRDSVNMYELVTADDAAGLVESLPQWDGRKYGWLLGHYKGQSDRLSNLDLGIDIELHAKRATAEPVLLEMVKTAPLGQWVPMRRFQGDKAATARKWVSDVRRGRSKRLAAVGPLEAMQVVLPDGMIEVRVRRQPDGENLIALAREIAAKAHGLQLDKSGHRYIDHPRRVAERLAGQGAAAEVVAAGWLHDVLEDTAMTADDLRQAGVTDQTIDIVQAVTKHRGEDLESYIARVRSSQGAVQVKWADLGDNTDPARLAMLDDETRGRLEAKYARTRELLTGELAVAA